MKQLEIQDCKIELIYLTNESMHSHQDIEVMYMIDSEAEVLTEEPFILKKNDIAVINSGEEHMIRCRQNAIAFRILIPYRLLGKLSSDVSIYFQCNSAVYTSNNYSSLERLLERLLLDYIKVNMADLSGISSILFQIIHELFENFKADRNKIGAYSGKKQREKIDRILNFIHLHYFEPLSLPEIAERFAMTETYLSRYFKEKVGQNYVSYLNDVRLENAVADLSQTDKSITEIALDHGFSTPSVFNRYFKSKYSKTPSEYRKEVLCSRKSQEIGEEKIRKIQQGISEKIELEANSSIKAKVVQVSARHSGFKWNNKNIIINIGETPAVCDAGIQKHILLLKNELGVTYARIWNIFSDRFMITNDLDGDNFNFFYLDTVLDFFVQNDIALFLDLGQRKRVIKATSKNELKLEKESNQPRNGRQWENLLNHFMKHLVRRYGDAVLEKWIFEFPWNLEPYYNEEYSYVSAYRIGRNAVRNVLKKGIVAGLSPNITVDEIQFSEAVRTLKEENIFPDIVTMRVFMDVAHKLVEGADSKAENGFIYAREFVEKIRKLVTDEKIECKFCISEWANTVLNRTAIQDSCARGTNAINFVSGISNIVDMMGIWYGSDAIDVFYDTGKLIYGSAGILTKDGIKKPIYYAFRFIDQLGTELLRTGSNYIITKDSSGSIVCLCYNQRAYSYYYYFKDVTEQEDLSKLFQSEEEVILEMEIADLEKDGEYLIKEEVVNSLNGSIQDEWKTLGNQKELGKSEIQYLRNVCIPKIFMKQFTCVEGRLSFHIELEPHEMRLIHISPY